MRYWVRLLCDYGIDNVNLDVIDDLLTQCVQKNNELSISGMMVFDGKQF